MKPLFYENYDVTVSFETVAERLLFENSLKELGFRLVFKRCSVGGDV